MFGIPGDIFWPTAALGTIILLVFGAGRVPDIARSLGSAVNEFKKGMNGEAPVPAAKKRVRKARS